MLIQLGQLIAKYKLKISGVLHVGAHKCEEMVFYTDCGVPHDCVYWVEGNQSLVNDLKKQHPNYKVYQAVVSDKDNQKVPFIVTNNGQSSSILELQEHKKEHPHVHEVCRYPCTTTTLKTLISNNLDTINFSVVNFINLDIQGAELLALKGLGDEFLQGVQYIYTEVNTKSLYKNCALLPEMDKWLLQKGFVRKETKMTQHGWGDAFYMRI